MSTGNPVSERPESHTVEEGEDLATIAHRYGYPRWEYVFFHRSNDGLRSERPNPFNLRKDDVVNLPPLRPLERDCETQKKHVFRLKDPSRIFLRLGFEDDHGHPYRERDFELSVEGMETVNDKTSKHGRLAVEVPAYAKNGKVKLKVSDDPERWEEWEVQIAALAPVDSKEGQANRLANLGYLDEAGMDDDEQVEAAWMRFQEHHELEATGKADDHSLRALRRVHGN